MLLRQPYAIKRLAELVRARRLGWEGALASDAGSRVALVTEGGRFEIWGWRGEARLHMEVDDAAQRHSHVGFIASRP